MPVVYIPLLSAVLAVDYESLRLKPGSMLKQTFFFRHTFYYCVIRGAVHKRRPQSGGLSIYGVSARTRWGCPVRTFFRQGEKGQFFAILWGRLFWTVPYN